MFQVLPLSLHSCAVPLFYFVLGGSNSNHSSCHAFLPRSASNPLPFPQSYSHCHCCLLFMNPQFFIWDNFMPKDFKNFSKASLYEWLMIPCDSLYNLPSLAPTKRNGPDDAVQVFDFVATNISPTFHS